MMKLAKAVKVLFVIGMITIPTILWAQIEDPDDVIDVPFDGGVTLLVAAGVGYGLKKAYDKKKVKKDEVL